MFFNDWHSILRIVVVAAVSYVLIVALLRYLGEEALAKMSAYDLLVTVALGSLLAAIPLGSGITIADGLAAVGTLLFLQQLMRWVIKRSKTAERAVRDVPLILLWDGELLEQRLREHSILGAEVRSAVRRSGQSSLADVLAVVLENDGEWSVIPYGEADDLSAFEGLEIPGPIRNRHRARGGHTVPIPAGAL